MWRVHWPLAGTFLALTVVLAWRWLKRDDREQWLFETWTFAKLILPLLLAGVLVAGFLLGRPGSDAGLIPARWVARAVGGDVCPPGRGWVCLGR